MNFARSYLKALCVGFGFALVYALVASFGWGSKNVLLAILIIGAVFAEVLRRWPVSTAAQIKIDLNESIDTNLQLHATYVRSGVYGKFVVYPSYQQMASPLAFVRVHLDIASQCSNEPEIVSFIGWPQSAHSMGKNLSTVVNFVKAA